MTIKIIGGEELTFDLLNVSKDELEIIQLALLEWKEKEHLKQQKFWTDKVIVTSMFKSLDEALNKSEK